ncbi:MAG: zinc ribbon domain-containing protein [Acidobacteria bacterium]|nr:MAG: zinc ribbon domain-containing protein [Acidobacteriota bacterium]
MPIYEYICRECSKKFEALVQGSRKAVCPSCKSTRLEQQLSVFSVSASAPKSSSTAAAGPCGSCGDPRGPGACSLDS